MINTRKERGLGLSSRVHQGEAISQQRKLEISQNIKQRGGEALKLPILIEKHDDPDIGRRLRDLPNEIRSGDGDHRSEPRNPGRLSHLGQPLLPLPQETAQYIKRKRIDGETKEP